MLNNKIQKVAEVATKLKFAYLLTQNKVIRIVPLWKQYLHKMPKIALSNICKLMAAMHLEFSIDHCYFSNLLSKMNSSPQNTLE